MLDLGTSFLASIARDPKVIAVVDGDIRLTYEDWYARISAVVAGFDQLGLAPGDHLVTALQNRWEAATLHWPGSSSAGSSRPSIGAPRPTRSIIRWRTRAPKPTGSRRAPPP